MSTFALENPSTGKTEDQFDRIDDADRDKILDESTKAFKQWKETSL